ncbi:MAG TPA: tetratricopeptide repeat protein, partial [Chthonomonadaceae bacterium]|nr:tetratricopeptide repeat protein [Chthonomonadaceae bacterium]
QSSLAQVLDSAGKHDEAIATYRAAIQLAPDDPILWGNLGWAQYNAARYDEAVQSSRKALQLDPKLAYVRFNLGLIASVRDRWNEAKREYDQALALASASDIHAGVGDVRDALTKQPKVRALRQALDYLSKAERKALSLRYSTPPAADRTSSKPESAGTP